MSRASAGSSRRRLVGGIVGGAGAVLAAGWVVQHRAVAGTRVSAEDLEAEGLTLPPDVVHHFVDADDGGRIHVMERGHGPALVLLHGFMLSGALWAHQLRDLADRHRVIAIELRGHGQSQPGEVGRSPVAAQDRAGGIGAMADDVRVALGALGVEHAVVVGHSMGGMVALQLVVDLPATELNRLVAGLVLVSTTVGPFSRLPGLAGAARLAGPASARAVSLADRYGVRALPSQDLRWWLTRMGFGADAPPAQVRFVEAMHLATPPSTVTGLLAPLATFDVSRRIGSIDVPVLVIVGSRDRLTPPRHGWRTAEALSRAELVELPRCGHMPMLERRREFARLLDEFAAKVR